MREIKDECPDSGAAVVTSPAERDRGWVLCGGCGRHFELRRGAAGLVVDRPEHVLPRHSRVPPRRSR